MIISTDPFDPGAIKLIIQTDPFDPAFDLAINFATARWRSTMRIQSGIKTRQPTQLQSK
jgi:hypothetical protein